jgi:3-oxoacyl-[acyl-carrier protein] reductase
LPIQSRLARLADAPLTRGVLARLGVPTPAPLPRVDAPWPRKPLTGKRFEVGGLDPSAIAEATRALTSLGAVVTTRLGDGGGPALDGLVFDATSLSTASGLDALWSFFGPRIPRLGTGAHVLVLGAGDTEDGAPAEAQAAQAALGGFAKSLARELGRRGSTANLLRVRGDSSVALTNAGAYFLTDKSAFVTGQVLTTEAPETTPTETDLHFLSGKTAVVTGAARGIGQATAIALAREGARLLLVDRPTERDALESLARRLDGKAIEADLSVQSALPQLAEALAAHGPLDLLVHNAGVTRDRTLAKMTEQEWRAVVDVNLRAILTLTPLLIPHVRDGGRVVFLSSVTALAGNVGQTAYAATKAALLGLTASLAWSLEPQRITVNAIAPGFIETSMTAQMPFPLREAARRLSALGLGGRPEDVAEAIVFLTSPLAQGISGQTLRVCGGSLLGG